MRTGTHSIDRAEDTGVEERTAPVVNPATGEQPAEVLLAALITHEHAKVLSDATGEVHMHCPDGVRLYTRTKVVTQRWPDPEQDASFDMPTAR